MKKEVATAFEQQFGGAPSCIVFSPGRINLIGEHVDYNDGSVMPAAIDKGITLAIAPREDAIIELYSIDYSDRYVGSLQHLQKTGKHWPDYLLGVADQVLKLEKKISGFSIAFSGNIPPGAGLSSSAALCCATIFALNEVFELAMERMDMVKLAKRTENEFIGLQCGIMDQFASMMGKKDYLMQLDCNSLEYQYFPLQIDSCKIVLFDTCVHHSLATSEYNIRRQECHKGLDLVKQQYPSVNNFQDVTVEMLHTCLSQTEPIIYNRCLYVVEEIARVNGASKDLLTNNIVAFGQKMNATHHGLSALYSVSCTELDFIANLCHADEHVLGARMMGGGFGGCVIAIVKETAIDNISQIVTSAYEKQFGKIPKIYIATIGDGTHLI